MLALLTIIFSDFSARKANNEEKLKSSVAKSNSFSEVIKNLGSNVSYNWKINVHGCVFSQKFIFALKFVIDLCDATSICDDKILDTRFLHNLLAMYLQ